MRIEKKAYFRSILASQSPYLRRAFSVWMPFVLKCSLFTHFFRALRLITGCCFLRPSWEQGRGSSKTLVVLQILSPLLLPSVVTQLPPLKSDKSALQSIVGSEVLQVDMALRSLSELCLGPIGPVLSSTSFVGNELVSLLGDSLLVWGEICPDMLDDFATYFWIYYPKFWDVCCVDRFICVTGQWGLCSCVGCLNYWPQWFLPLLAFWLYWSPTPHPAVEGNTSNKLMFIILVAREVEPYGPPTRAKDAPNKERQNQQFWSSSVSGSSALFIWEMILVLLKWR